MPLWEGAGAQAPGLQAHPPSRPLAALCAVWAVGTGLSALVGWAADITVLKSISHDWVAMQPWTAVGLIVAGLALLFGLIGAWALQAAALLTVAAISGAALVEHYSGIPVSGLDTLLFPRRVMDQPLAFPGRMAELTAIEFLLFAASVALTRSSCTLAAARVVAAAGLLVAVIGTVGYLFGAHRLTRMGSYTAIALHTAGTFALVFLGNLLAMPAGAWLRALAAPRTGGRVARHLFAVVVLFPLAVGVSVEGLGSRLDTQPAFRMAVAMVTISTGLLVFVLWMAQKLNQSDEKTADADHAMRTAETRLRAVVDTAVDAMVVIDDHGTIQSFNKAAEGIFGYTADEAIGQDVRLLMPEPDRTWHSAYMEAYRRTGIPKIIGIGREVRGLHKDGSLIDIDLSIAEWWDDDLRFFTGIMRDVTERKRTEAALHDTAARLQFALHGANAGMWDWNLLDGTLMWTDEIYALTGLNHAVPPSYDYFLTAVAPGDRAATEQAIQDTITRREPHFRLAFRVRHPAKGIRWLSSVGRVSYDQDGAAVRMSGITMDISDLKRAEEEAERANQSKSRFLAAASHDLRQPVQALMLFTTALALRLEGHPAAGVVTDLSASLNALQNLLEELLDISRLDAGVITPKFHSVPLRDIIGHLTAEYTLRAHEKGLGFQVVKCRNRVVTDPTLLERIVRNLIENAIRYTDQGRILVGCRRRGGQAVLQVIDTGIGIPSDQQDAIFQEFYQLGNPTRDQSKGLGLGLSIVQRLAQLLGHPITIVSTPGKGTCFSVELTLAGHGWETAEAPPAGAPSPPPPRQSVGS